MAKTLFEGKSETPHGACRLRRCGSVREMDREGVTHGSRVGVRCPRRITRRRVRVGPRIYPGWKTSGQHLARRISLAKSQGGWVRGDGACRIISAEWVRALRYGWQRVGVDHGLVSGTQPERALVLREL